MTRIGHVLVGYKSPSDRDRSRPWDANPPVYCWILHRFIPGYNIIYRGSYPTVWHRRAARYVGFPRCSPGGYLLKTFDCLVHYFCFPFLNLCKIDQVACVSFCYSVFSLVYFLSDIYCVVYGRLSSSHMQYTLMQGTRE